MADLGDSDLGDITKMKVADLKRELKMRGLDSNGNKSQLIQRLQTAVGEIAETDSMLADPDTDEILDEDEVLADETLDDIDDIHEDNISPELPRSTKRKLTEKSLDAVPPMKKITLNRTAIVSSSENEIDDPDSKEEKAEDGKEGRKVIKLSEFTVQERLEKRAAKFGVAAEVSSDARKEARAIRFGITSTAAAATSNPTASSGPSAFEQLKKRSERFGTSVSSILTKAEEEEKLQKRRERFGLVEPTNGSVKAKVTSSTTSTSTKVPITFGATDSDEKKKLRAERFKIKI